MDGRSAFEKIKYDFKDFGYFDTELGPWRTFYGLCLSPDGILVHTTALILKMYPAEMIAVAIYCFFLTIQSLVVSLIAERDLTAWRIETRIGLIAVLYMLGWALVLVIGFYGVMWGKAKEGGLYKGTESSNIEAPLCKKMCKCRLSVNIQLETGFL
ncbi:hypothetical protein Sango_1022800 [Sesamum angolense]|uniref:Uncharacterized protein n=1 Tax=Sesamum angolense TaxID=2727404 RepID=A0AAE1X0E8_9LAMI|nr:hypothetical protein Sango_1022800 [Sesamum angolense]